MIEETKPKKKIINWDWRYIVFGLVGIAYYGWAIYIMTSQRAGLGRSQLVLAAAGGAVWGPGTLLAALPAALFKLSAEKPVTIALQHTLNGLYWALTGVIAARMTKRWQATLMMWLLLVILTSFAGLFYLALSFRGTGGGQVY